MRVSHLANLLKAGVHVHHNAVRRVPVRGEQLFLVRRKLKRGDLSRRDAAVDSGARGCVPDVDGAVVCAASGGKNSG